MTSSQFVLLAAIFALLCTPPPSLGQSAEPLDRTAREPANGAQAEAAVVTAVPLQGAIQIDGRLNEQAWLQGTTMDRFTQRDPLEGAQPTERTVVTVLYDDEAIYVAAHLYDSAPDSVVARLGRRDAELEADRFVVFLDPYLDRRSGLYFGLNAAGTLYDGVLLNDDWDEPDWDGVWQGGVARTGDGWTAEMRIPYSQLRFYRQEEYVWGVNFLREISRKQERDFLAYSPRNESGFVSRFWDLVGIRSIQPERQLEVIPYVTTRVDFDQTVEQGNPFHDGSRLGMDAGADLRLGLTPNLTLNATVNPDFGQVEVDPAVINLSDTETFFSEKRPFFIEGASNFDNFGYGGASNNWGFNWGNPQFFYSRRIGRSPGGELPENEFSRIPESTSILGAAKVTGKIGGSWNVGTIQAMTARERADLYQDARSFDAVVEPPTYYGVYRAQKEFPDGRQGLGVLSTVNNRFFTGDVLEDQMNARSLAFGVDGWTFLDPSKTWVLTGWSGASHVRGTPERLLQLQESSLHYFQRPDAGHVEVDSSATSMTGWSGRFAVNKQRGRVIFNSAIGAISPSFDVNDVGFQWRSDILNGHLGGGYRWPDPGRFTRSAAVLGALFRSFDFGGRTTWTGAWARAEIELLNYYRLDVVLAANPETVSTTRTRGGPITLNPPGVEAGLQVSSDRRRAFVLRGGINTYQAEWTRNVNVSVDAEWKPAANVSLAVGPSASWNYEHSQWVDVFHDELAQETFGRRYVFAEMDQLTLASSLRLNWTFTPRLSFQLYAQPLVSVGDYENYKELARARSYGFRYYGENASTFDPVTLEADPDGPAGPAAPFTVPKLDFNVASLRGTAVLRWEYKPGSTLYFVWTQQRSDSTEDPRLAFQPALDQLRAAPMENVFVIKLTYWFNP
jgi:hypothetical protein